MSLPRQLAKAKFDAKRYKRGYLEALELLMVHMRDLDDTCVECGCKMAGRHSSVNGCSLADLKYQVRTGDFF